MPLYFRAVRPFQYVLFICLLPYSFVFFRTPFAIYPWVVCQSTISRLQAIHGHCCTLKISVILVILESVAFFSFVLSEITFHFTEFAQNICISDKHYSLHYTQISSFHAHSNNDLHKTWSYIKIHLVRSESIELNILIELHILVAAVAVIVVC